MFFRLINQQKIGMQSIENKTLSDAKSKKYGTILFASDFENAGERKTMNSFFKRIALYGKICRPERQRISPHEWPTTSRSTTAIAVWLSWPDIGTLAISCSCRAETG